MQLWPMAVAANSATVPRRQDLVQQVESAGLWQRYDPHRDLVLPLQEQAVLPALPLLLLMVEPLQQLAMMAPLELLGVSAELLQQLAAAYFEPVLMALSAYVAVWLQSAAW